MPTLTHLDLLAQLDAAQTRAKIDALLLPKLPESLQGVAKRREHVRRLLQEMREAGEIVNLGKPTRAAIWALKSR